MNDETSDMPKKIRLELWVNEDMSHLIKKSSLELTTEEIRLFCFADNLVQLRGVVYEKAKNTIIQQDSDTGKVYRTFTYGLY